MNKTLVTSFTLTVAAIVASGCSKSGANTEAQTTADEPKVKCMGINECKGQGACDTATHSCAGQNECKGKGWILAPKSECERQGGEVI